MFLQPGMFLKKVHEYHFENVANISPKTKEF